MQLLIEGIIHLVRGVTLEVSFSRAERCRARERGRRKEGNGRKQKAAFIARIIVNGGWGFRITGRSRRSRPPSAEHIRSFVDFFSTRSRSTISRYSSISRGFGRRAIVNFDGLCAQIISPQGLSCHRPFALLLVLWSSLFQVQFYLCKVRNVRHSSLIRLLPVGYTL